MLLSSYYAQDCSYMLACMPQVDTVPVVLEPIGYVLSIIDLILE